MTYIEILLTKSTTLPCDTSLETSLRDDSGFQMMPHSGFILEFEMKGSCGPSMPKRWGHLGKHRGPNFNSVFLPQISV